MVHIPAMLNAVVSREPLIPVLGGGPLDGADITRAGWTHQVTAGGLVWTYRLCRDDDGSEFYLLAANRAA